MHVFEGQYADLWNWCCGNTVSLHCIIFMAQKKNKILQLYFSETVFTPPWHSHPLTPTWNGQIANFSRCLNYRQQQMLDASLASELAHATCSATKQINDANKYKIDAQKCQRYFLKWCHDSIVCPPESSDIDFFSTANYPAQYISH